MNDFTNDIAIIGMACHFPGAPDLATFWKNLVDGVESISHFSSEELLAAGVDPAVLADPDYVPAYGWLDGIDQFDAPFFGFTPREAQLLDPQQRLFLMCAWHALEDAAVNPQQETRPIGVFAGAGQPIYYQENILSNQELITEFGAFQTTISNDKDFLATRTSYKLNLKGPSLSVQTACSTSLVAVHLAIQSLLNGECDVALAGGSSMVTTGKSGYLYSNEGLFSPDGHCRAFDAQAGGMVGGDGVGAVVLKRLEDALAEGNTIYAVIKGSAVNNDGSNKIGYTAPSVDGQAAVILEAQAVAAVHPETITMIEAHGTGTPLGDPIEVAGLTAAFRTRTSATNYCALGSVKTNIGHTNAAAGVAGLIKTALALHHKTIPPSLNFQTPNPEIDFERSPFYVNTKSQPWLAGKSPRRAGVSSFGLGGTNAHAILEEAPTLPPSGLSRPYHLLTLSAKTETALERQSAELANFLHSNPNINLADVAYTLQVGRQRLPHRRTALVKSLPDAVQRLQNPTGTGLWTEATETADPPIAFIFPGGGAQYVNMGRDLYETEPLFRSMLDQCVGLLQSNLNQDIRTYIYPPADKLEEAAEQLKRPSLGLPALFAVSYATAQLWLSWGVQPQVLMGHSLGEYVAACLSGVFSLTDALRLVVTRGRLFEQMPAGAMLSVNLSETAVQNYFQQLVTGSPLSIAAVNAPEQCVIAGTVEDLAKLEKRFLEDDIQFRQLAIDVAAHSVLVESILDQFRTFVASIPLSAPEIPIVSNVSGSWLTAEQATNPDYWANHLRQTVRFAGGLQALLADSQRVILEVGPGQVLTTLARLNPGTNGRTLLNSLRHPRQQESDVAYLIGTLGRLWQSGITVNWAAYYANERRRRLSLPPYPFDKQSYWLNPKSSPANRDPSGAPQKNPNPAEWLYTPSWQRTAHRTNTNWPEKGTSWLLFTDAHELAKQLEKKLQAAGQQVICVFCKQSQITPDNNNLVIDPKRPQEYIDLLNKLDEEKRLPAHIIHLCHWGPITDFSKVNLDRELDRGFFSMLYLAQAIEQLNIHHPIQLTTVTSGMQEVTGLEPLAPERAAVLGPCKVIPFEYEHIRCLSIDTDFPALPETADHILAETLTPPTSHTEAIIAHRGPFRWQQSFTRVPVFPTEEQPFPLREKGVYLITGGLGGIGLALAEYLARTVQARLILVGRSNLPPRSTWAGISDLLLKEQIHSIMRMEESGAEVMVATADVTSKAEMEAVLKTARARFGSLNGIIHSAGIAGDGAIALKKPEQAMSVLAAKLHGTQILHNLCPDDLDFMVLCSSGTSILGGYGQVDYCAANAVLDAYAPYRTRQNVFSVSIDWDLWQSVGMGIKTMTGLPSDQRRRRENSLKLGITPQEGQLVFRHILNTNLSQAVVSTYDFVKRYEKIIFSFHAASNEPAQLNKQVSNTFNSTLPSPSRPNLDPNYRATTNKIEAIVAARWQLLFGIETIGIHDDFFALGGHSLLATQLLNRLRKDFPTYLLSLHDLFANPTIAGVSALISEQMGQTDFPTQDTEPAKVSNADPYAEQLALLTAYLQEHLPTVLDVDQIDPDTDLRPLGIEANTANLIWLLRRDMALRIYPHELIDHPTLNLMADYLAKTLVKQQTWTTALNAESAVTNNGQQSKDQPIPVMPVFSVPKTKNPPVIFILSAPRSGSTLLRLMLGGHPALFCPPELSLLAYESLNNWREHQRAFFTQTGLHTALSNLFGLDNPAIEARLDELSQHERPIQTTYRLLQEAAAPQTLVDKTPGYALHPTILARAEAMFEQPKYIHLIRHPYSVIESFVRHRLHIVLGQPEAYPALLAEKVWLQTNQNLLNLSQQVSPARYHQILYEELVQSPRPVMARLCKFLDIPFDERLLQPYTGQRMIAGPGDPDILQHNDLDPEMAHIWQKVRLPHPLQLETQSLAAVFGYELPNEHPTTAVENSTDSLSDNLENLSDAEVDALLRQMLEDQ